jgi:pyrimidine-specific ribonucleoside hydrolase
MSIPVILDVDTGVDDALAILLRRAASGLEVLGISCVAGNARWPRSSTTPCAILDAARCPDLPVAAGAVRPLLEPAVPRGHVHGTDGLGGIALPPTSRSARARRRGRAHAPAHPRARDPVTLVALAPQTNLALLLRTYPEVAGNLERIVFMGGRRASATATAVAEFNVWHDPEAAAIVLDANVPAYMYGLDVFNRVAVDHDVALALEHGDDPSAGRRVAARASGRPAEDQQAEYTGLIGERAVCSIVDPLALRTEVRPVRVGSRIRPRQTLVDLRERPARTSCTGSPTSGPTSRWRSRSTPSASRDCSRHARLARRLSRRGVRNAAHPARGAASGARHRRERLTHEDAAAALHLGGDALGDRLDGRHPRHLERVLPRLARARDGHDVGERDRVLPFVAERRDAGQREVLGHRERHGARGRSGNAIGPRSFSRCRKSASRRVSPT